MATIITVGLGVLSPHPQLLQYMLLTTGAFALVGLLIFTTPGAEGAALVAAWQSELQRIVQGGELTVTVRGRIVDLLDRVTVVEDYDRRFRHSPTVRELDVGMQAVADGDFGAGRVDCRSRCRCHQPEVAGQRRVGAVAAGNRALYQRHPWAAGFSASSMESPR